MHGSACPALHGYGRAHRAEISRAIDNQRVVDDAHILSDATKADLTAKLKGLEDATTDQVVVVTVPDLQGDDIRDYGYKLGRTWGIGQNGTVKASNGQTYKNNGLLLIVAPNRNTKCASIVGLRAGAGR